MGIYTYLLEHHPQARMNRVIYDMQQSRAGVAGFRSFAHETFGFVGDVTTVGQLVISRGSSFPGSLGIDNQGKLSGLFYDPGRIDRTSFGALYVPVTRKSIGSTRRSGGPVQAKTPGGNSKPSRPTRSGQTSKPFWSQGKPKCKKGFRYDFKRKLCVKIK
jgi:hypothetical protein